MSHFKHLTKAGKLAMERTIVKWQGIVDGTTEDYGPTNCACCQSYAKRSGCGYCPISIHVEQNHCKGTPYVETSSLHYHKPVGDQDMLACMIHIYLGDEDYKG